MSPQSIFPRELAEVPTTTLLDVFAQAPDRLAAVLKGLDERQLRRAARGPATWSIGEIVLHLADSEIVAAARFRMAIAHPGRPLIGYDQDVFASAFGYDRAAESDVQLALHTFAALRGSTGRLLRTRDEQEWELAGSHPDWGQLTVRQLLELYADHGERHLDQIMDIRGRLGERVPLASVLPHRLDTIRSASTAAAIRGN